MLDSFDQRCDHQSIMRTQDKIKMLEDLNYNFNSGAKLVDNDVFLAD